MIERHMRPRFKAVRPLPNWEPVLATRLTEKLEYTLSAAPNTASRWFSSSWAAYCWIARGWLFCIRSRERSRAGDKRCFFDHKTLDNCPLCLHGCAVGEGRATVWLDGGTRAEPCCAWHDHEWFKETTKRVARLLRHYHLKAVREAEKR